MEELKRFQGSTFDTFSKRKLLEDRDTVPELTSKIQEIQNEINCMNDSRDLKDAASVRGGPSHVPSQPAFFPPHPRSWWNAKPFSGNAEPQKMDRQAFGTHMVYRETFFVNPTASSSAPYPQELNPWSSKFSEHTSPHLMSESQTPAQDQRCQSGPSARNSVIPCEGDSSKNYGADQQRLQISDLHLDKFRTPATFACWKLRFKTEVCTCSQFPTKAMLWIKEVEMVDSVDD